MFRPQHYRLWIRSTARLMFGVLAFLILTSFLALPCLTRDAGQFQQTGGPQSCNQHEVFRPQADLNCLFNVPLAEAITRLFILLPTIVMVSFVALLLLVSSLYIRRHPPFRIGRLPFGGDRPSYLPAYAALRDA